jgi:hypothetical protein
MADARVRLSFICMHDFLSMMYTYFKALVVFSKERDIHAPVPSVTPFKLSVFPYASFLML